jgi:hypothetical protein
MSWTMPPSRPSTWAFPRLVAPQGDVGIVTLVAGNGPGKDRQGCIRIRDPSLTADNVSYVKLLTKERDRSGRDRCCSFPSRRRPRGGREGQLDGIEDKGTVFVGATRLSAFPQLLYVPTSLSLFAPVASVTWKTSGMVGCPVAT